MNHPGPLTVQHLFAVGRNHKTTETSKEWFRLARAEIKLRNGGGCRFRQARHARDFAQEKYAGLARIQADVIGRLDRQGHNSLADSIQVDRHCYFVFLVALFSFVRALYLLFRFVCILGFIIARGFLLVTLRFDGRSIALLQHNRVNASRHRVLITGKIEPANGKSEVRAGSEIKRLAVFIEYRIPRITGAVRDLRFLSCFQGINKDVSHVVFEKLGIGQPLAVR